MLVSLKYLKNCVNFRNMLLQHEIHLPWIELWLPYFSYLNKSLYVFYKIYQDGSFLLTHVRLHYNYDWTKSERLTDAFGVLGIIHESLMSLSCESSPIYFKLLCVAAITYICTKSFRLHIFSYSSEIVTFLLFYYRRIISHVQKDTHV